MLHFIKKYKEVIILIAVYILSTAVRLKINFATEFIPGNISAYYLLQVRSIIEEGRILFNDFPILFWIQAIPTYLFTQFEFTSIDKIIDYSVRAFDSIVPPMLIFVTFHFSKKNMPGEQNWTSRLIISAFAVTYIAFFELISDYQKNSFSLILIMAVITVVSQLRYYGKRKNLFTIVPLVVAAGLTHFGSFIVVMLLLIVYILIDSVMTKSIRKLFLMLLGASIIYTITCLFIYLTSPHRAGEFLKIPLTIFDNPILISWIKGKQIITTSALATSIIMNGIALLSIVKLVRNYNKIDYSNRISIMSFIFIALLLSSPLIGITTADRIQFIAYLFGIPLVVFMLNYTMIKKKRVIKIILTLICVVSVYSAYMREVNSVMNKYIYAQLNEMRILLNDNKRELFVARHGMEFWVSMSLREDVAREDHLAPGYWSAYDDVLFIHQKKGIPNYRNAGTIGMQFREPFLPPNSKLIFSNEYFDVYKSYFPPDDFSVFKIGE